MASHDADPAMDAAQMAMMIGTLAFAGMTVDEKDVVLRGKEVVGAGYFAQVVRGTWKGASEVAVKRVMFENGDSAPVAGKVCGASKRQALDAMVAEITTLVDLGRHPNLVELVGACLTAKAPFMVTLYAARGTLFDMLTRDRVRQRRGQAAASCELTPRLAVRIALGEARALSWMHSRSPPVMHRDLKSPNLLLTDEWVLKLADFGLARTRPKQGTLMTKQCGTFQWMAPEVFRGGWYSELTDVWSFGCNIWEVATGNMPYRTAKDPFKVASIVSSKGSMLQLDNDVLLPGTPRELLDLIRRCLALKPAARPTMATITTELEKLLAGLDLAAAIADGSTAHLPPPLPKRSPSTRRSLRKLGLEMEMVEGEGGGGEGGGGEGEEDYEEETERGDAAAEQEGDDKAEAARRHGTVVVDDDDELKSQQQQEQEQPQQQQEGRRRVRVRIRGEHEEEDGGAEEKDDHTQEEGEGEGEDDDGKSKSEAAQLRASMLDLQRRLAAAEARREEIATRSLALEAQVTSLLRNRIKKDSKSLGSEIALGQLAVIELQQDVARARAAEQVARRSSADAHAARRSAEADARKAAVDRIVAEDKARHAQHERETAYAAAQTAHDTLRVATRRDSEARRDQERRLLVEAIQEAKETAHAALELGRATGRRGRDLAAARHRQALGDAVADAAAARAQASTAATEAAAAREERDAALRKAATARRQRTSAEALAEDARRRYSGARRETLAVEATLATVEARHAASTALAALRAREERDELLLLRSSTDDDKPPPVADTDTEAAADVGGSLALLSRLRARQAEMLHDVDEMRKQVLTSAASLGAKHEA